MIVKIMNRLFVSDFFLGLIERDEMSMFNRVRIKNGVRMKGTIASGIENFRIEKS